MKNCWCVKTSSKILIYLSLFFLCEISNCTEDTLGHYTEDTLGHYIRRTRRHHLIDSPEQKDVLQVLELLKNENIDYENDQTLHDKRGIGLGTDRGHSGTLLAKHNLGRIFSEMPNGPGRRRRRKRSLLNL